MAAPQTPVRLPVYTSSLSTAELVPQPRGQDLLRLLGLRWFFRWKYARLLLQLPLLLLALLVIIDGLTGRQLAPRNVATTAVWLHYRGLVVIALAMLGNAFCAACPLMLTRGLSRRLETRLAKKWRWPAALKNKYLVTLLLLGFFFSYEYFDLWASPWLTAWLAIGYFVGALAVDTLFPAGTFCKYLCPLGNFNFLYASASPSQIAAIDHDVCRRCVGKPCLHGRESYAAAAQLPVQARATFIPLSEVRNANGSGYFPGCETQLFVPTMQSNMDCTLCFNCLRACPYDNVALKLRAPTWEWSHAPWRKQRLSLALLAVLMTAWAMLNAIAMIGPWYSMAEWTAGLLHTRSEALILGLFFAIISLLGVALPLFTACLADRLGGLQVSWRSSLQRWAYVLLALGFGFWTAHYLFHFFTGALSIIPVLEHFFWYRGAAIEPNWRLAQLIPNRWLFSIGATVTLGYTAAAIYVAARIALRDFGLRWYIALMPMLTYAMWFAALALWVLAQPMEMRGTIFGPTF